MKVQNRRVISLLKIFHEPLPRASAWRQYENGMQ